MGVTANGPPQQPSLTWRNTSSILIGLSVAVSKGFLYGLNKVETIGLERFVELIEQRRDVKKRTKGLITVSNHISIIDDPLIWGVLPLKYSFNQSNLRWSLAAHDICFQNPVLTTFFNLGKTLPTYRFRHSPYGGLFQPTMSDAIRILSSEQHGLKYLTPPPSPSSSTPGPLLQYPPTPSDPAPPAPSYQPWDRHGWVHIFPEACVHQHPERALRYFKWGVARLVLESGPEPPDVVPMFIDGTDRVMHEDRGFPRFLPRVGRRVRVVFGEPLDFDLAFGDLKRKWDALVASAADAAASRAAPSRWRVAFPAETVDLEHGEEARAIRVEVTRRIRDEVLKLRHGLGYPDQDPEMGLAETWAREPGVGYTYKSRVDGSKVNEKL
ncbi:hypothetical protein MCOR27_008338 [Pyricularia oryzae]|uniref:Tafazzin family protein n=1 Tax=Pyricularia grisea TaxID=148305 RepID=A0ABQ8NBL8_PYRGI|nr:hypothetical protein MCOR01_011034 [Pyricularia oryzae]KAI6294445.1 hypothetical protein MCOR33_008419 [Pyricularia grisea]KAH9437909.1 hypothetical protein MCOR02_001553 [Pyricularia oryzae]KAI6269491.1 hypothetical protein MCOR26_008704 [Pyricularia oryzae]KAI6272449.1 hypothetical protein MCOR27_008338 [Pyricularia oryzae]